MNILENERCGGYISKDYVGMRLYTGMDSRTSINEALPWLSSLPLLMQESFW